jgi:hypothetical protein
MYMAELLNLTESASELEFVQLVSAGLTRSVRPVWATVQRIPEETHYAINYPQVHFHAFYLKGNQNILDEENIA